MNHKYNKGEKRKRDFSDFYLYAEYTKGEDKISYNHFPQEEECAAVYGIVVGEDLYIGSANKVFRRATLHFGTIKSGKHANKDLQEAFNRTGWAKMYILMRVTKEERLKAETFMIKLMHPTLNTFEPTSKTLVDIQSLVWKINDKNVPPLLLPEQTACPWCGNPLNIKIEKDTIYPMDYAKMSPEERKRMEEDERERLKKMQKNRIYKENYKRKKAMKQANAAGE